MRIDPAVVLTDEADGTALCRAPRCAKHGACDSVVMEVDNSLRTRERPRKDRGAQGCEHRTQSRELTLIMGQSGSGKTDAWCRSWGILTPERGT